MRQEIRDALQDSPLSEAARRHVIAHFDEHYSYALHPLGKGPIPAEIIAATMAEAAKAEAEVAADPKAALVRALDACFFGTPTPREGSARLGHARDGWRDGVSHPFAVLVEGKPKTYDILMRPGPNGAYDAERTREQYTALLGGIDLGAVTKAP